MAKLTLLPKEHQEERTAVSSFTFQGMTFTAGETQEVNTQVGIMYMDNPNVKVEFTDNDFKELDEELLEEMGQRLSIEPNLVKSALLPKKSVAAKVKSTLSSVKLKETDVETSEEITLEE